MNVAGGPPPPLLASASQTPYAHPGMSFPAEGEPGSSDVPPWLQPGLNMRTEPVDSNGRRRRGNLPKPVTTILRNWFHEHLDHPYPSEEDKQMLVTRTGLSISQVRVVLLLLFKSANSHLLRCACADVRGLACRSVTGSSMLDDDSFRRYATKCVATEVLVVVEEEEAATTRPSNTPH